MQRLLSESGILSSERDGECSRVHYDSWHTLYRICILYGNMPLKPNVERLLATVMKVSGATFVGVAVLLFVGLPFQALAFSYIENFDDQVDAFDGASNQNFANYTNTFSRSGDWSLVEAATYASDYVSYDMSTSTLGTYSAYIWIPVQSCVNDGEKMMGIGIQNEEVFLNCDGSTTPLSDTGNPYFAPRGQWNKIEVQWDSTGYVFTVNDVEITSGTNSIFQGDGYPTSLSMWSYAGGESLPAYLDDVAIYTDADIPNIGGSFDNIEFDDSIASRFTGGSVSLTSSTTPPVFSIDYIIDTADWFSTTDRPDTVIVNVSSASDTQVDSVQSFILPLSNGSFTEVMDGVAVLEDGDYTATVFFWNFGTMTIALPANSMTLNFTVVDGAIDSQALVDVADGLLPSPTGSQPCGISNIGGCINNSFVYLFYPSSESLTAFSAQYENLKTTIPFVYAFQAGDLFTGMFSGTGTDLPSLSVETGLGTIDFFSQELVTGSPLGSMVPIVKNLIAAALWLMLFVALYRKTLRIHDNVTV